LLAAIAVEGQKTPTTKYESDPNNLYEPIEGYDRVEGDFGNLTIPSFLDWFDWHPAVKWGAIASIGALALLATQGLKD
jgi:hypothetical protein